ncbi:farnesol dehydrogenase-like isoform X2 [Zophobas morio]|uniref:farnesol dehydrogenase-like isoform X2 n=1 Tax=Zophobas morio TaxID=2755281 RepID=UPI0030826E7B
MVLSMDRWVLGIARRSERIEESAKLLSNKQGKLHAIKADLTKEEDILKAFKWAKDNLEPVHILINNAGRGAKANLTEGETRQWKKVFDLNVLGLSMATREAVKVMKENQINGHIIHMNSVAGHQVLNFRGPSVYCASKFAVTALTETLRQELNQQGLKIKVTSVSPGMVESEMTNLHPNLTPEMKAVYEKMPFLKSEDIADAVVYALSTPEHVQIPELTIKPVGEKINDCV